jgi:hypothetical protein
MEAAPTPEQRRKTATRRPVAEYAARHPNTQFTVSDVLVEHLGLRRASVLEALRRLVKDPDFPLEQVGSGTDTYIFRQGIDRGTLLKPDDLIRVVMQADEKLWLATDDQGNLFRVSVAKIS